MWGGISSYYLWKLAPQYGSGIAGFAVWGAFIVAGSKLADKSIKEIKRDIMKGMVIGPFLCALMAVAASMHSPVWVLGFLGVPAVGGILFGRAAGQAPDVVVGKDHIPKRLTEMMVLAVLAIAGAGWLSINYEALATHPRLRTYVLVAKKELPAGTILKENMLKIAPLPRQYMRQDAYEIRTPSDIKLIGGLNLITAVRVSKGDQLTTSNVRTSLSKK